MHIVQTQSRACTSSGEHRQELVSASEGAEHNEGQQGRMKAGASVNGSRWACNPEHEHGHCNTESLHSFLLLSFLIFTYL